MSAVKQSIARMANAVVKLLPNSSSPPNGKCKNNAHNDSRPMQAAIASPRRSYRIYARPDRLLLRNEQGVVLDLGVMKGTEPNLTYRLYVRNLQGRGFATRTLLLDDIAQRIQAGDIGGEPLDLPESSAPPGADLDRGTHMDVSMKLAR
ncbi:hypothetical protein [Achromobacter aegrifaciens]